MLRRSLSAVAASACRLGISRGGRAKAGSTAMASIGRGGVGVVDSSGSIRCASVLYISTGASRGSIIDGGRGSYSAHQPQRRLASSSSAAAAESSHPPPTAPPSGYAAVDHGVAYEEAIASRHGAQLRLAYDEGIGKDDPPYDPFREMLPDEEGGGWERSDEASPGGDAYNNDEEDVPDTISAEDQPLTDDGDGIEDETYEDEEDEMDPEEELEALTDHFNAYNKDGSVRRKKSELVALKSGLPAGGIFAVIDLNGSQQKVTVDDVVIVNKLRPVDRWAVGNTLTLTGDDVLLVGSTHLTLVGLPGVKGAEVDVMVEEITRDATVLVFKKRKRKHSRRKNGFRREVTMLRVLDIRMPERHADHEHRESI